MDCPKLERCIFFADKMAHKPAMASMLKQNYCKGDNSGCARFKVSQAGRPVPDDLYPNQEDRAKQLLAAATN